ncbi:hypothetical protein [Amnibacterium kyonggiense]|uniref:Uncharacterized protein n=1 Tax=Amnibacterium kyonggiense TaxID=595671 RepID=A0A4R7FJ06_9MICO|nr:hypothetical protein [Amnibacterium kyonggiense]TDS75092.1 hypothetical protein CLV52_3619 [Amnibacterium kyonggiense]
MSDERDDAASRSEHDPVTGNPEGLPDLFGEDPEHKKPLVQDASVDPEDDRD